MLHSPDSVSIRLGIIAKIGPTESHILEERAASFKSLADFQLVEAQESQGNTVFLAVSSDLRILTVRVEAGRSVFRSSPATIIALHRGVA